MNCNELQKLVDDTFEKYFNYTPLTQRIDDITRECDELKRFGNVKDLKKETGDALSSIIKLCAECDWNFEDLVRYTCEEKIPKRAAQYKSLGRKYQIALLGGAMDCMSLGHKQLAQFVLNTSKTFDEIWIVPAFKHMYNKPMVDFKHRFNMCKLTCEDDKRIKIFDYEYKHQLAGETYHFVKKLINDPEYENFNFSFIIGYDNAITFDKWVNYTELEKMIRFVVVPRQGFKISLNTDAWYLKRPHIFLGVDGDDFPIMDVSSTMIRNKIKNGESVENLIHPNVYKYIKENNLYLD